MVTVAISHIKSCVEAIQSSLLQHQLKMNDNKTEFLVMSSKPVSHMINIPSLKVSEQSIFPSSNAQNLGVIIDSYV